MNDSLRTLLVSTIDYAGQFPPARLALDEALANFHKYQSTPDHWMLGRFVCPINQLGTLSKSPLSQASTARLHQGHPTRLHDYESYLDFLSEHLGIPRETISSSTSFDENLGADSLDTVELVMELEEEFGWDLPTNVPERIFTVGELWQCIESSSQTQSLTVVGTPSKQPDQLPMTLRQDVRRLVDFESNAHGGWHLDSFELRLPSGLTADTLRQFIDDFERQLVVAELPSMMVFLELPITDDWADQVGMFAAVLQNRSDRSLDVGMKIRTGGEDQLAHPSPAELAHFIEVCSLARIAWKATAGLHQPLWHFNPAVESWQFGFLNVLTAGVLASINSLRKDQITEILTASTIDPFEFDQHGVSFDGCAATRAEIEQARTETIVSFGSCSYLEPIEGLRELKLM